VNIPTNEIEVKKAIGKNKKGQAWYIKMRGGLHLVTDNDNKILGMASHRAVARHVAQMQDPDLEYTELSKSEYFAVSSFEHLIPEALELTKRIRDLQG